MWQAMAWVIIGVVIVIVTDIAIVAGTNNGTRNWYQTALGTGCGILLVLLLLLLWWWDSTII